MKQALRYEIVRLRTIRSTWWLTGLALAAGLLISGILTFALHHDFTDGSPPSASDIDGIAELLVTQLAASGQFPSILGFILAMIGIFSWGHEYRHGMIRASLTAVTSRTALWTAKYLVCGVWVAVVAFVTMALTGLIGQAVVGGYVTILDGDSWAEIGRTVIYVVLLTWLAMAFTAVTRAQAFALVTIFLWPLLIENLINGLFLLVPGLRDHREITRFLPFSSGRRLLDVFDDAHSTWGDPLSHLGGGLVFGGLAVVLMAVSLVLFQRRDA